MTVLRSCSPQSLLLQIGKTLLEEEAQEAEKEKMKHMEENCPALSIPQCTQELQVNLQHGNIPNHRSFKSKALLGLININVYGLDLINFNSTS